MKKRIILLSTLLSVFMLSGCGSSSDRSSKSTPTPKNTINPSPGQSNTTSKPQPNKPHDTSTQKQTEDTTEYIELNAYSAIDEESIHFDFYDGIPLEIKHYQFFIDTDYDETTGFSGTNDWAVKGADYLIEDNSLFKSTSDTKWEWEYVGAFENVEYDADGEHIITDSSDFDFYSIFPNSDYDTMTEFYNDNWVGNYFTVVN